jgi:hypothetical protein
VEVLIMLTRLTTTIVKSLVLALALGAGLACGALEESLLEQECFDDSDCGPLDCVIANPNGLNPTLLGWCAESPACVNGKQPFCPCGQVPGSSDPVCMNPTDYNRMVPSVEPCWDQVDPNTCLCLPIDVTCEYDPG